MDEEVRWDLGAARNACLSRVPCFGAGCFKEPFIRFATASTGLLEWTSVGSVRAVAL